MPKSSLPAEETLYTDVSQYFEDLFSDIQNSTLSVDIEIYILAAGSLNDRLFKVLSAAVARGVKVRLLVDGIGSYFWILTQRETFRAAGVRVRVFHPVPSLWNLITIGNARFLYLWRRLNRRDHRKFCIIDHTLAYTGSLNISNDILSWRETGLRLTTPAVAEMQEIFYDTWTSHHPRFFLTPRSPRLDFRRLMLESLVWVRTNSTFHLRRKYKLQWNEKIKKAKQRIWLMTPYFIPPFWLFTALRNAAKRGVDVRIIVPARSDIKFTSWVARLYYKFLQRGGVEIFEYTDKILHAKVTIIDDWEFIGSSNLNHRSFLHDLELDVVLSSEAARAQLAEQFLKDLELSKKISIRRKQDFLQHFIARLLYRLRDWF